mgnify:FL=1
MRIVIVGGVAGGMSAATRARRMNEQAEIIVLEKGGYISFANCGLPYYLGGQIQQEKKLLVTTPPQVAARFNIDARVHQEVTHIDRAQRQVTVRDLKQNRTYTLAYDKLILATGATPIIPRIEHVHAPNVFLLRSMEDTEAVRDWLERQQPRSVAIVGAGFIGLEMAEAMHHRGLHVTVIEKASHALPPLDAEMAVPVHAELKRHGVELITGTGLASLEATGEHVGAVVLEDGRRIEADMVLLSIGVRPNTKLAADAGLEIGPTGGIVTDEVQRTSDPDIYAVGDAVQVVHGVTGQAARIPLAGPANRQGRTAGEHAATGQAPPSGRVLGTAIVKVFDLTVATTGLSERDARRHGYDLDTAYVVPSHHAGYYPGAEPMRIKLVYEAASGRVLGAQAVGGEGVDKRIDVIATAIHFGGTVDDLAGLDLAYAPPFGAAKDPVHMAAFVAQNQRRSLARGLTVAELSGAQLIDVRNPQEYARGSLPNAINIPLDELRERLGEIDPARPAVVFCQVGQRGYVAQRILEQRGYTQVCNLKGGLELADSVVAGN